MQAEAAPSTRMPMATGLSLFLHLLLALALSTSLIASTTNVSSQAVTFVLTPSSQAPIDTDYLASQQQLARPGEIREPPQVAPSETSLALMQAIERQSTDPLALATEVKKLQGELTQLQEDQAQNTRLGSVAARQALDADYLRRWVKRVEGYGTAALANVGSARGDVRLLVVVNKLGILLDVAILESSGFPHLDRAAIKTVQDAAPYPAFPPALSAQVDKLEVVRTWQFRP